MALKQCICCKHYKVNDSRCEHCWSSDNLALFEHRPQAAFSTSPGTQRSEVPSEAPGSALGRKNMNRAAFEQLINENLAWLLTQSRTLERDHIEGILQDAPKLYYGGE